MITEPEVNLELMTFIETHILPQYNAIDKAEGLQPIMRAISRSLVLAKAVAADANMAYVVAAYHDLGMSGPKAIHHLTGGKILSKDMRLRRWFSQEQLRVMKEAVEDHRATMSHAPRSIYGSIIAEAVRDFEPSSVFKNSVVNLLKQHPDASQNMLFGLFKKHLKEKYAESGYIKLWIQNSQNERDLKQIRTMLTNEALLQKAFQEALAAAVEPS